MHASDLAQIGFRPAPDEHAHHHGLGRRACGPWFRYASSSAAAGLAVFIADHKHKEEP
jgi:hypothetical protein